MDRAAALDAAENFQISLDLQEAGIAMMRQNLRRRFPVADEAEVEARLVEWLLDRPGDADGEPVPWPRRAR